MFLFHFWILLLFLKRAVQMFECQWTREEWEFEERREHEVLEETEGKR